MSSLSAEDVDNIKHVWNIVEQDELTHATEILVRLFTSHSDIQQKFDAFKSLSCEQIREEPQVHQHVLKIFQYLGAIINVLQEEHLYIQTVYMLAVAHKSRHASTQDFQSFRQECTSYLQEVLADSVSAQSLRAFDKFLDEIAQHVSPHLNN